MFSIPDVLESEFKVDNEELDFCLTIYFYLYCFCQVPAGAFTDWSPTVSLFLGTFGSTICLLGILLSPSFKLLSFFWGALGVTSSTLFISSCKFANQVKGYETALIGIAVFFMSIASVVSEFSFGIFYEYTHWWRLPGWIILIILCVCCVICAYYFFSLYRSLKQTSEPDEETPLLVVHDNKNNVSGLRLLMVAGGSNKLDMAERLFFHGANPNERITSDTKAVEKVAQNGKYVQEDKSLGSAILKVLLSPELWALGFIGAGMLVQQYDLGLLWLGLYDIKVLNYSRTMASAMGSTTWLTMGVSSLVFGYLDLKWENYTEELLLIGSLPSVFCLPVLFWQGIPEWLALFCIFVGSLPGGMCSLTFRLVDKYYPENSALATSFMNLFHLLGVTTGNSMMGVIIGKSNSAHDFHMAFICVVVMFGVANFCGFFLVYRKRLRIERSKSKVAEDIRSSASCPSLFRD